jgi:hypothetical protein
MYQGRAAPSPERRPTGNAEFRESFGYLSDQRPGIQGDVSVLDDGLRKANRVIRRFRVIVGVLVRVQRPILGTGYREQSQETFWMI